MAFSRSTTAAIAVPMKTAPPPTSMYPMVRRLASGSAPASGATTAALGAYACAAAEVSCARAGAPFESEGESHQRGRKEERAKGHLGVASIMKKAIYR